MERFNISLTTFSGNLNLAERDLDSIYNQAEHIVEQIKTLKKPLSRKQYDKWMNPIEKNLAFMPEQIEKCNNIKLKLDNYIDKLNKLIDTTEELGKQTNNYYLSFGLQGQLKKQIPKDTPMDEQQRTVYDQPALPTGINLYDNANNDTVVNNTPNNTGGRKTRRRKNKKRSRKNKN